MRKMMQWVFAATLIISGLSVLTACSSGDDNNNNPPVQPADDGGNSGVPTSKITYIDHGKYGYEKEEEEVTTSAQWLNAATVVEGQPLGIKGDWYVTGYGEINEPIKATYHLRIILCDDAVLKVKSIIVEGVNNLIINGQKRGTGQLIIDDPKDGCPGIGPDEHGGGYVEIHGGNITAKGSTGCAAIGGGHHDGQNLSFSKISIYGGVINATGGDGAAGIGGGVLSVMDGEILIYGGDIHAQGGGYTVSFSSNGGAGIGGGCNSPARRVIIMGGNIHATGGREAAGIGCGQGAETSGYNDCGHIDIYDGYVEAYGKDHAAGIGGGDGVYLDEISIRSGTIKAYGGVNAAGIGGGEGAKGGRINISGGTVYAYAGADGAGIGGGEDGDGGTITISGGLVFAYGNHHSDGFGAGICGGQDGNSGTITISGGEVHAYGGDDAAGIGTGEATTSGPNIKADNITISGGAVEAVGGGKGAGVGAGQDAEVGTITITMDSGSVYVSGRSGNDCGWWAGAFGAYDEDDRGTLNIGKGVKTMSIEKDYSWSTIPVAWNPVAFAQQRCHVLIQTCDHPGGHTAETCVFCKH